MLKHNHIIISILIAAFLSACIPTKTDFHTTWHDKSYQGEAVKKVLILALAKTSHKKMAAEDIFKESFEKKGVTAVSSYKILPSSIKISKETVKAAIEGHDINAVFVVQLVGTDTATEVVPGYTESYGGGSYGRQGYYHYYGSRSAASRQQTYRQESYAIEYENAYIDSKLFMVEGEKLVWQVQTKTVNAENFDKVVKQISDKVVSDLSRKNFL